MTQIDRTRFANVPEDDARTRRDVITIRKVLCPIDLSGVSSPLLDYATTLARWYDARLTILHVVDSASMDHPRGASTSVVVAEDVRRFCEPWTSRLDDAEVVVDVGSPVKVIAALAERLPADLLVLGTHGRSGFERLWLGSVSEKVLRRVNCPVLTVPPHAMPAATGIVFKTILCAVDFSDSSMRALEYALPLAEENFARLILLHAVEPLPELAFKDESSSAAVPEYERLVTRDASARLASLIPEEASAWCRPETVVVAGTPHREILRTAADCGSELIVMGVQGRGAIDLALFGSTAHHVIRGAHAPVLTIRAGHGRP
jgi:nucleotide-binding universal stress UspA family protein